MDDPKELQSFERQPAFRVYPAGEDPLPSDIQKIRDKWVRLGVDIGTVWRIIRMGCNILEDAYVISDPDTPDELTPRFIAREDYARKFLDSLSPHMRKLVKRIRNDNRKPEEKEKDRERLMAHCGEWPVTSGLR